MKIYLASKSPRRRELLLQMGVDFEYLPIDLPEEINPNETPDGYSTRITSEKLDAAWEKILQSNLARMPVLCADTEVVLDKEILGKPTDYQHAFDTIKTYSGRTHTVITSVGVKYLDFQKIVTNSTEVHFAVMTDAEIHRYLATENYKDKAGSYGIQSYIGQFITKIDGCFYSVMGLPLNTVRELLRDLQDSL